MKLNAVTQKLGTVMRSVFLSSMFIIFYLAGLSQTGALTGKVMDADSKPLPGVTIIGKGTNVMAMTAADGSFSISLSAKTTVIQVSSVGFETKEIVVTGKSNLDIILAVQSSKLNEVVVTGYSSQRKKDIIGAVAVVDMEDLKSTPSANIGAQLQGRASGVTVSSTGAPGSPAVVRIRGFQSSGNNNPLYVIDGVPTEDPSVLNPQDVESMQVLKDGTAAAIYGTRAANGVVIVTTKQGRAGRSNVSYENYVGFQSVTNNMVPNMLDNTEYMEYLRRTGVANHVVFGAATNFKVPDYIVVSAAFKGGVAAGDPKAAESLYSLNPLYQILKTSPQGTDWFDAILRKGLIQSHQITATGGTDKVNYSVGMNYFNQKGTFINTGYDRYTVRANTTFKPKTWLRFGENLQVSNESRLGGVQRGEGGAWSWAYRMVPYIPVYDIKGGFGGNAVGESGNGSNPVANLIRDKDDQEQTLRIFGNAFAEIQPVKWLIARTSMGISKGSTNARDISRKTYERSENQGTTQLNERVFNYTDWTLTNTLAFSKVFADKHDVKILAGTEAIRRKQKQIRAFGQRFDFDNADFISLSTAGLLPGDRNVFTDVDQVITISSLFGRADYAFKNKYLVNGTVRRDGASVFGPANRYGTFVSYGMGWRMSEEKFLKDISWLTDLKLRGGVGSVGSISNATAFNSLFTFTSTAGGTNYDIAGTNSSAFTGYRLNTVGNLDSKWETTVSKNVGIDMTILNGKWDFNFNVYQNDTRDLLVPRQRNSMDIIATQPLDNLGTMRNTGIEFTATTRGKVTHELTYDVTLNFSRYKNEVIKLNNEGTPTLLAMDRFSNALITNVGLPISSFYGYQLDGFYNSQAEVDKGVKLKGQPGTVGTWKYKDINGDGNITSDDVTVLGSPHPKFQLGTQIGFAYRNFDFNAFLFWNYGNKIYNYTKWYTDMRGFVGGVSDRILYDTWTPQNTNAKLPVLQPGQNGFNNLVTGESNSYYVESGSYLRAKNVQLGYTFSKGFVNRLKLQNIRMYVQAQNLFTVTKYSGADPDLTVTRGQFNSGVSTDNAIGIDVSGFPNPKQYLFGLNVSF